MEKKHSSADYVSASREYIEAVPFIHYVERIYKAASAPVEGHYIEEIHERDGCKVSLKCGTIIKSLETKKTIQKRIDIANIMKERVAKGFLGDDFIREVAIDIAMEYDKPATKADIAIIARELLLIKESLLQNYYKKD